MSKTKKRKMTKAEARDRRDNTALAISAAGLAVSVASLVMALNRRPSDEEDEYLVSEGFGPYRRR